MADFEHHINKLFSWVQSLEGCPDQWSGVLIVEDPEFELRQSQWNIPNDSLMSPEQYNARFEFLLERGYSWININFGGVFNGKAVVFIEFPKQAAGIPKHKVPVNFSGPCHREWDLTDKIHIAQ